MERKEKTTAGLLEDTIGKLEVDLSKGLSYEQVFIRRQKYGPNELQTDESDGVSDISPSRNPVKWFWNEYGDLIKQYIEQFQNPLILLLIGSATISLLLGQYDNAISITLAVVVVGTVGFIQEYRTEKSLDELNKLAPPKCHVLRDDVVTERLASELVPGDVVELRLGDRVPADMILIESVSLEFDESMMTGEHETKNKMALSPSTWPSRDEEALCTAYMGTLVKAGRGKGIVVAIGPNTELGRLFKLVEQTEDKKSPLQVSLDHLGQQLTLYSGLFIGLISIAGLFQSRPLMEIFTVAVSLAVAAIPEGLPVVATITLALGVLRLSRRKVIVRKLPAVEALGSVNILCADKTGTLTTNELSVQIVFPVDGEPLSMSEDVSRQTVLPLLRVASLCNNASRHGDKILGNAIDVALYAWADKLGYPGEQLRRLSEVPFSSDRKYMTVQCDEGAGFFVKGAPEVIASMLGSDDQANVCNEMAGHLHSQGLRTLALASGPSMDRLKLVGLLGLMDPPRPDIAKTLSSLRSAHLRTVMVTGDAKETAVSLASVIGFPHAPDTVVSGSQLEEALEGSKSAESLLSRLSIVYRASPKHKLLLVQSLQIQLRAVVAMTGDGVNDAPALKMADIGVAMGKSGTDVARESAKLILTDDNLAALLDGVHEGKAIFANIRHFVRFQLATSLAALGLIAAAAFLSPTGAPPLNPMQILLINIIMDGPPAQSLGVEPIHADVLSRPPRPRDAPILSANLLARTGLSALFVLLGCTAVFYWELQIAPGDTTRTFTAFVLFSLVNAFCCRSLEKSVFSLGLLENHFLNASITIAIITLLAILYMPVLSAIFQTSPLPLFQLAGLSGLAGTLLIFDELVKFASAPPTGYESIPTM